MNVASCNLQRALTGEWKHGLKDEKLVTKKFNRCRKVAPAPVNINYIDLSVRTTVKYYEFRPWIQVGNIICMRTRYSV